MGGIKPHWEWMHDCELDDLRFDLYQIYQFKIMIQKSMGEGCDPIRSCIKTCKDNISRLVAAYENKYGDKPDLLKLRREVENGNWQPT